MTGLTNAQRLRRLPAYAREAVIERAAIIEFDAGIERWLAERMALDDYDGQTSQAT